MKSIYYFLQNKSIRFKLIFHFVLIILVSIISLSVLGSKIYRDSFEQQANQNTLQMINQVETNMQLYLDKIEDVLNYVTKDPEVIRFFQMQQDESATEEVKRELKRILSVYSENDSDIAGIIVVNRYDQFISNEMRRIKRDPLSSEGWYKEAIASPGKTQMISNPIGRNITIDPNYSVDDIISMTKAITDPKSGDVIGVILVDVRLDFLKKVIKDIKLGQNGFIYITDEKGEVVYTPINAVVYRIKHDWIKNSMTNTFIKDIGGQQYRILYNVTKGNKWNIVGVLSLKESLQTVTNIQYFTLIISIVALIFAIIASTFFTGSITKPIKKLSLLMKKIEKGELNHRFNSKYNDEIGYLGHSFNHMIEEINKLINLVYLEQKKKREAELQVLQAQIKPHFLYNTLDTIQWMAQEYKARDIVEMIAALTNLLRTGLNKGNERIKIDSELKHVESYMFIQMTRYERKLNFKIYADEEVLNYYVLKVILQPLVENAIYHGIKSRRGNGNIIVRAKKQNEAIIFSVIDNGIGIKPKALNEINYMLEKGDKKDDHQGYGLFNVNERIKLTYGSSYGIRVDSEYGEGTTVILRHPLVKE